MNPWGIVIAAVVATGLWFGGEHAGYTRGMNAQKVADQQVFDQLNKEREQQVREANTLYRTVQDENLALMAERENFKTQLEEQHELHQRETNALHRELSRRSLRFAANGPSQGHRDSSPGAESSGAESTPTESAPVVQLPDALASDLRQLALDADRLRDDYRKCYDFAQGMK